MGLSRYFQRMLLCIRMGTALSLPRPDLTGLLAKLQTETIKN